MWENNKQIRFWWINPQTPAKLETQGLINASNSLKINNFNLKISYHSQVIFLPNINFSIFYNSGEFLISSHLYHLFLINILYDLMVKLKFLAGTCFDRRTLNVKKSNWLDAINAFDFFKFRAHFKLFMKRAPSG